MSSRRAPRESARGSRIRVYVLGVIAGLLCLIVAASWGHVPAPHLANLTTIRDATSDSVTITVGNVFAFSPNYFEVNPGDSVTVTVVQTGSLAHTFTLSRVANFNFTPAQNTTSQLIAFFALHPPLVNLNISGTAGNMATTFTAPAKGTYQFVCLQAGHFQSGMNGVMGSGVPVGPPPTPSTGPGAPVFIIGGTIVSLVVLAIVLGFVVGRRKGAVHEMPPERLGYREPTEPPPLKGA